MPWPSQPGACRDSSCRWAGANRAVGEGEAGQPLGWEPTAGEGVAGLLSALLMAARLRMLPFLAEGVGMVFQLWWPVMAGPFSHCQTLWVRKEENGSPPKVLPPAPAPQVPSCRATQAGHCWLAYKPLHPRVRNSGVGRAGRHLSGLARSHRPRHAPLGHHPSGVATWAQPWPQDPPGHAAI